MVRLRLNIPRIVIAGTNSGVGKTTITAGIIRAFAKAGLTVQAYKIGPDYIDPGYHAAASGRSAHNLDTWLLSPECLKEVFATTAEGADIAVIEGVMGLYDGGRGGISSTAEVAKLLNAPVVLVIDAKAMGASAGAIALGFRDYDRQVNLAGIMVNRLGSPSHRDMVIQSVAGVGVQVVGAFPREAAIGLPERHLGLVQAAETDQQALLDKAAVWAAEHAEVEELLRIAQGAPPLLVPQDGVVATAKERFSVRIGVAKDEAFTFYYPQSLEALEMAGATIVPFSPLTDQELPPSLDGLIFGGGYPELYLERLSGNQPFIQSLRQAAGDGIPIYAECGGFMYLMREVTGFDGRNFPLANLIPADCVMEEKLQMVGYVQAEILQDSILGPQGTVLRGHEFHFSRPQPVDASNFPWAFRAQRLRTGDTYTAGFVRGSIFASYLHLHFAGQPEAIQAYLQACEAYQRRRGGPL